MFSETVTTKLAALDYRDLGFGSLDASSFSAYFWRRPAGPFWMISGAGLSAPVFVITALHDTYCRASRIQGRVIVIDAATLSISSDRS